LAYHIYNTPGFVLGGTPSGESSRFIFIFTRDLGLVGAHAQNTRHTSSKLRYALDSPARSHVSLVRGKNMWRLVSAVPETRFVTFFKNEPEKLALVARIFSLLKKLLPGEDADPQLFVLVDSFLEFLNTTAFGPGSAGDIEMKDAEAVLVLRMLHRLGYIPDTDLARQFAHSSDWTVAAIAAMKSRRKEAVGVINESLKATDL
jgi:DNA repair protein RecO